LGKTFSIRLEKPSRQAKLRWPGLKEESWSTPGTERPEVAKRSQAESGANVRQGGCRWRTWTSGLWLRRRRDPKGADQGAVGERSPEVATAGCMKDRMKILRSKNENQREERLDQA
jgi:hypothetical protein